MGTGKQYIAITLGPISRIMSYTQSTKSFWRASYFMSYLGKQLITDFFNKKRTFLKPQLNDEMWTLKDGVGRFPDQYIFAAEDKDYEEVLAKREEVLQLLSQQIAKSLSHKKPTAKDEVYAYLKDTLKIYILEYTDSSEEQSNNNPQDAKERNVQSDNIRIVEKCQKALSVMECQDIYPLRCERNYLAEYFEMDMRDDDFLLNDAFFKEGKVDSSNIKYQLFKSIIEITAVKAIEEGKISKTGIYKDKNIADLAPKYKYIAFVSADGDNVGKTIGKLGTKMSNVLWEYSKSLTGLVEDRGGMVIYSGGDDLVLFAPAANVFQLINEIDKKFQSLIKDKGIDKELKEINSPLPTLSFGVSMSYYKYPMSESLQKAENLLCEAKDTGRNRIAWSVRKHSGQSTDSVFDKNQEGIFNNALDMINFYKPQKAEKGEDVFLHSFAHYLLQHQEMLAHILRQEQAPQLIQNYIKTTFDDTAHNYDESLDKPIKYLLDLSSKEESKEAVIQKLYSLLRYIELFIVKEK